LAADELNLMTTIFLSLYDSYILLKEVLRATV
jgi:hypothetical protein